MIKEWKIFLTAIMYFTRIRVPASIGHDPEMLQKAPRYFPAVGWVVGGLSALAYFLGAQYISPDIGILASMITGILTTGAFHEDGFADVCDGFGGGWTKDKILLIMKDSRIGAFGAIGLLVILGSKFLLLKELDLYRYFILILLSAHSLSRLMPVLIIHLGENVTDPEHSKSKPVANRKLSTGSLVWAILSGAAPLAFLPWPFLFVILPAGLVAWWMARYFKKWIGGYTGDCLGAVQQVTELTVYLSSSIIIKHLIY